jgi:2-polyprenyl-3-methyl-5-hydroxy-6-metoxy-1,4-benzoquinol methylase
MNDGFAENFRIDKNLAQHPRIPAERSFVGTNLRADTDEGMHAECKRDVSRVRQKSSLVMDQQWLAKHVVDNLFSVPEEPAVGRFISITDAQRIVSATIDHVGGCGDPREFEYLKAHRRRLATSLSLVPMAETADSSFLDVGCYGYMAFWASRHLGYRQVEGIELRPDLPDAISLRSVNVGPDTASVTVYNFDISDECWPLDGTYDTVLLLEVLEHINIDPSGVLANIAKRMRDSSILLVSVPNALSYITLREFVTGAPPWNYWFFHPDLSHEPRHCFEYPPIFFKIMLQAAGFSELAFRTVFSFSDPADLDDMFEIANTLSIDPRLFGDTLIAQVKKVWDTAPIRYPDCIYNGDQYYESTYPTLEPLRRQAIDRFLESRRDQRRQLEAAEARAAAAEAKSVAAGERLMEIEASTTWRITAPIRRFAEPFPKSRARIRSTLAALAAMRRFC